MATSFPSPRDPAHDPDHPLARAFASLAPSESRRVRHQPALPSEDPVPRCQLSAVSYQLSADTNAAKNVGDSTAFPGSENQELAAETLGTDS
jgi:hypothetical protein